MTTLAPTTSPTTTPSRAGAGLTIAVVSAAAFGMSGSLARSLLDIGWSPAAVVAVRVLGACVALAVPCALLLRRTGLPTGRQWRRTLAYGAVAVAGTQYCYFSSVQYLEVGVALLLEYLAPILLIFWHWGRSRKRPAYAVFAGAGLALAGLVLVLDLGSGFDLHPLGVLWGLGAAVCLAGYFILSEGSHDEVSPLVLTTVGSGVGGTLVLGLGLVGVLPLAATADLTALAGVDVPWWLPLLLLIGVSAVLAYLTGIVAVRRLGSSVASFVSLSEVIFAVVAAIVLLGQNPSVSQLFGGALVLAGIAVVQRAAAR